MAKKNASEVRIHKIKIKKPFNIRFRQKIVCPYCNNSESFYEVIENATIFISYIQNPDGTLDRVDEEIDILGPVKFFCGVCNSDLTYLKKNMDI